MNHCKIYLYRRTVKLKSKSVRYWCLKWHDSQGRQQTEQIGKCGVMTRAEADALRQAKLIAIGSGEISRDKPEQITLAEFAEIHAERMAGRRGAATMNSYRIAFDHAKAILGESTRLDKLDLGSVHRLENELLKGRKPSTVAQIMTTFISMMKRAVTWGFLHQNPAQDYESLRVDGREIRVYTSAEVSAMLDKDKIGGWWYAFLRLLADSGLRLNEALNLRWSDIDLDEGTVSIRPRDADTFSTDGKTLVMPQFSVKAKASIRTIPITPRAVVELRRLQVQSNTPYCFVSLKELTRAQTRIMPDGSMKPARYLMDHLLEGLHQIQTRAGVAHGRLHDFRSTCLTRLASAGIPMHELQRLAGHSDISTTARHYLTLEESSADRVRAALASVA